MAIEEGTPFAFCGRIVEAYYTNPELDTVGIIWSDGEKNREQIVGTNSCSVGVWGQSDPPKKKKPQERTSLRPQGPS